MVHWFVVDRSIDWLIQCSLDWLIDWLIDCFFWFILRWFIDECIFGRLTGRLIDWLVECLVDWLIDWLIDWLSPFCSIDWLNDYMMVFFGLFNVASLFSGESCLFSRGSCLAHFVRLFRLRRHNQTGPRDTRNSSVVQLCAPKPSAFQRAGPRIGCTPQPGL